VKKIKHRLATPRLDRGTSGYNREYEPGTLSIAPRRCTALAFAEIIARGLGMDSGALTRRSKHALECFMRKGVSNSQNQPLFDSGVSNDGQNQEEKHN